MQHVKDEIAFLEASVISGFNVQDLVIDLYPFDYVNNNQFRIPERKV
jgi:hypothetical protein